MSEGAGSAAVREWVPDAATHRRTRRETALYAAGVLVVYAVALVRTRSGAADTAVLLGAAGVYLVTVVLHRQWEPTASGPAPRRAPTTTDPERVPPPSPADFPRERRGVVARASAALLLVAAAAVTYDGGWSAGSLAAMIGVVGLVNVDLPWLWRTSRIGRRPLARTTVTVHAVGRPTSRRVVLASGTVAWSALRVGVLHDVVVGDVLVADLGGYDSAVLTLGDRRSLGPDLFRLLPDRFRTLTGTDLGASVAGPPA